MAMTDLDIKSMWLFYINDVFLLLGPYAETAQYAQIPPEPNCA